MQSVFGTNSVGGFGLFRFGVFLFVCYLIFRCDLPCGVGGRGEALVSQGTNDQVKGGLVNHVVVALIYLVCYPDFVTIPQSKWNDPIWCK